MSSYMIKINIGGNELQISTGVCTLNNSGHLSCTSLCCKSGMAPEYTGSLNHQLCGTTLLAN